MAFWTRAESAPAQGELRCSFCGKSQREVRKLIAGPKVYVCDDCVGLCNDIIAEDDAKTPHDPIALSRAALLGALVRAEPHPVATRRRIVEALLGLAGDDAAGCRAVAHAATRSGDHGGALLALGAITESARTPDDVILEACIREWLGDHEAAITMLDGVDCDALSETARAVVPLHRALFRLAQGALDREEAERHAATAAAFRARLPTLEADDAYRRGLERQVRLVEAYAARSGGHLARAEALVRTHLTDHEVDALAWSLLSEILDARGQNEHAAVARESALRHADPSSALAERLRQRRTGPFR